MEFTIKDTPPSIKGSTVTGGNKIATLENNATVTVPMFLSSGDKIIVNTETGEYVERA
jgi:elongation factor P